MTAEIAHTGHLAELSAEERETLVDRAEAVPDDVRETVQAMAERIQAEGDQALVDYTERFDDVRLEDLVVPEDVLDRALEEAPEAFVEAFQAAVDQIQAYHESQLEAAGPDFERSGVRAYERVVALDEVGIYVPGGTAAYPSTVAMTVVPARAAGVDEITVATPPGPDGRGHPLVLAACRLLDVDRVVPVGGAQAVLGLALGTDTVPPQDAVVGPGNVYVQAAKEHVAGSVRIDAPAGPSEVAVLCDDEADPAAVARELAAQAEHDTRAVAIALCEGEGAAKRVTQALDEAIEGQPRADVIEEALATRGAVLTVEDVQQGRAFLDELAPEHCTLMHREADRLADELEGPACIVAGDNPHVPFTDYVAGPSHVLPTGGAARAHSGISAATFTKRVHVSHIDDVDADLTQAALELARLEGFEAHANAMEETT